MALQYDGNKMNKVCKACYSVLTGQSGDSVERRTQEVSLNLIFFKRSLPFVLILFCSIICFFFLYLILHFENPKTILVILWIL